MQKKLAKEKGLPVICINSSGKRIKGVIDYSDAGIEEWLGLFINADFIFTNSFHGTAFAINFEVPMYVSPLPFSMAGEVNSRLIDVLERYGLGARWIPEMADVKCMIDEFDRETLQRKKEEQKRGVHSISKISTGGLKVYEI